MVIDEIGKMELFSRSFQQTVKELLKHPKVTVFATIPAPGKANPFVEEIRHRDDVIVFTVSFCIINESLSNKTKTEPLHKKTNILVSDQVRHKPGCKATEDG